MKTTPLLLVTVILLLAPVLLHAQSGGETAIPAFSRQHDLNLPPWGPYTKNYIGLSHIPDADRGVRFDLSVFPGFYRRKVEVPNVMFETNYHPWEATAALDFFSFRHELEWKDRVYADISYLKISDDSSRLVRMQLVNNTDIDQNLTMNFMASVHFPSLREYQPDTPLYHAEVVLPPAGVWIDATDYSQIHFTRKTPQDNLVYNGMLKGEIRADGLVSGSGIGHGFGKGKGDKIRFEIADLKVPDNDVVFRYRIGKDEKVRVVLSGVLNDTIAMTGTGAFELLSVPLHQKGVKNTSLTITSLGGAEIQWDGIAIVPKGSRAQLKFRDHQWNSTPEIIIPSVKNTVILKYKDIDQYYGIHWTYDDYVLREVLDNDLDVYFRRATNNHVATKLRGDNKGHYTNVFMKPVLLKPRSGKILYGRVYTGNLQEVTNALRAGQWDKDRLEQHYRELKSKTRSANLLPDGKPYLFGDQLMRATIATNVVYPVYTQKSYIRHRTPGRWWDSLYTWDSGFIGLGLLDMDTGQAIDNLRAYLMDTDNPSAFLHHGTPLPVQHYLYREIWNRTQSLEFLKTFYPQLKRYHDFLAGHEGSSTTDILHSGLLKTWDYFYNSGGWDDYPPQAFVHKNKLQSSTSPVINTAHAIRTAKIMKQAAILLGLDKDVKAYDRNIQRFSRALQSFSWDEASGYFGYVPHTEHHTPAGILKTAEGENLNMGLGGASPLISGICTEKQQEQLLQKLRSDQHLWSKAGLSAVDQSASYYRNDGYWNGTVWMPHQWFFFKAMLDMGEADFAYRIAKTALETWKRETEATYNCMEHFIIDTGRGAGWHQFGALSSPVVNWFSAYYKKGIITTGYDFWIREKKFAPDHSSLHAKLIRAEKKDGYSAVIVTMQEDRKYQVKVNGKVVSYDMPHNGCLVIRVPNRSKEVSLEIL